MLAVSNGDSEPDAAARAQFSSSLVADVAITPAEFWAAAELDRLVVQRCQSCGARLRPGPWICPLCRSTELDWVESTGRGTIYSLTEVHQLYHPEFTDRRPYCVGLVDLDDGPRLATRLLSGPSRRPAIGDRVYVTFVIAGGRRIPTFELDAVGSARESR